MDQTPLTPFAKETNLFMLLRNVQNAISAPFTFDYYDSLPSTIHSLRVMHKYHNVLFNECFDNIIERFKENLLTEKHPDLFILSLSLVKDIFSKYEEKFNDNWITVLVPSLIKGIISLNKTIQSLSLECFNLLSNNMLYTSTIISLIEILYTHNDKMILSTAINAIKYQCDSFPVITIINSIDWNDVISDIPIISSSQYETNGNARSQIKAYFTYLKHLTEKENQWNDFIDLLTEDNRERLFKIINE